MPTAPYLEIGGIPGHRYNLGESLRGPIVNNALSAQARDNIYDIVIIWYEWSVASVPYS